MRKRRNQVEFNNSLLRVADDISSGVDLVDACRKESVDPNSFVGKLVRAGMTIKDISEGRKRFPIHFKRQYDKSEQDEAIRQHLEGVPWSKIAYRLGASPSTLSHWLNWKGYWKDPNTEGEDGDEDESEAVETQEIEYVFSGGTTDFRNMVNGQVAHFLRTYFMQIGEEGLNSLLFANVDDDKCPRCGGKMRLIVTRDGSSFAGCLDYRPNNEGCSGSTAAEIYKKGRLKRAILDFEEAEALSEGSFSVQNLLDKAEGE